MINTVSISDLKQNTSSVVKKMRMAGESIVVLQHSKPAAVLVNPDYYNLLEQALEDLHDLKVIEERKDEPKVSFANVAKKLNLNEN